MRDNIIGHRDQSVDFLYCQVGNVDQVSDFTHLFISFHPSFIGRVISEL